MAHDAERRQKEQRHLACADAAPLLPVDLVSALAPDQGQVEEQHEDHQGEENAYDQATACPERSNVY